MGLLIVATILAPLVGVAAAMDWRSRRRRKRIRRAAVSPSTTRRAVELGLDIGDLVD